MPPTIWKKHKFYPEHAAVIEKLSTSTKQTESMILAVIIEEYIKTRKECEH